MNIGIDATCWWNNRGFGRFTRGLLSALFELKSEHTFYLFVDQALDELRHYDNVQVVWAPSSRPTTEAAVADGNRSPLDIYRMYRAVKATPLDIMFFPAVYSWYPVPRRFPSMITVHDAIAEHYPELIFPGFRSRLFWTIKMRWAVWASARILTVSNAAKEEIVNYIGADPELIDVTSEAPNPEFRRVEDKARIAAARERYGLPPDSPLIIFVGGLAPHKNLHGLLDGFEQSLNLATHRNVSLVLVGDFRGGGFFSNYESLKARVQSSETLSSRVYFTGYVAEEDLVALYSTALAVAMPSYSEGFGLPAVEAMACAAPILASDRGSLPEVVGDGGIYFDPFDASAIANAIRRIIEDLPLRESLSRNALARAATFTWDRAASVTLAHLEAMYRADARS